MSKTKKYLRIYVNGKKIRSTGSHPSDYKSVLNMFMLKNGDEDITRVLYSISGAVKLSQIIINIETVRKTAGVVTHLVEHHVPYRFINTDFVHEHTSPFWKYKTISPESKWVLLIDSDNELNHTIKTPHYGYNIPYKSKEGTPLISHVPRTITCKNFPYWDSLYFTDLGHNVTPLHMLYSDANKIEGVHITNDSGYKYCLWRPKSLVEFAIKHDLSIGTNSYIAICFNYAKFLGMSLTDDLPTEEDLRTVLTYDYGDYSKCVSPREFNNFVSSHSVSLPYVFSIKK